MKINGASTQATTSPSNGRGGLRIPFLMKKPEPEKPSEEVAIKPVERKSPISRAEALDGEHAGEEARRQLQIEQKTQAKKQRRSRLEAKVAERDEHERWRSRIYKVAAYVLCALSIIAAFSTGMLSCLSSGWIAQKITGSMGIAMLYAAIFPLSAAALEVAVARQPQVIQDRIENFLGSIFLGIIVTFVIGFSWTFGVEADPTDMAALLVGEDYRFIHVCQVILELIATFFFLQGAREHWETIRYGRENKRWIQLNEEARVIDAEIQVIDDELIELRSESAAYQEQVKRAHAYAASVTAMLNQQS